MNKPRFALGKLPARKDAVKLKLRNYLTPSLLPTPPKDFGHEDLVPLPCNMLGNDQYGDCVLAGAGHETMLWNAAGGKTVRFNDSASLSDYSAITGFDPLDPNTDQGTDMQVAASYRRKTGIVDADGKRHKVAAYLAITPGDVQEHLLALYLFGAVGIGIKFPSYAMDQFNAGKPWTRHLVYSIEGGHYIPLVGRRKGRFVCVTWGKEQPMSDAFFRKFNDESVAYVSLEMLKNGRSLEGFDAAQLQADLAQLK
jgi:hypothetical protein